MLKKFSHTRSNIDNIKLGVLTAFTAGMVNVASLVLFFSFTSNVTGHYAILAEEIAKGKWFQVFIVISWIFLFFAGSFLSNFIVINGKNVSNYISHSIPLVLELICFVYVGIYGVYYYQETLMETEMLVAVLLFSMGLQNGLTASISNFSVKTTHLTGLTTDLAVHLSMITQKEYRDNPDIIDKIKLLSAIAISYLTGGIIAGSITYYFEFKVFFYVSFSILIVLFYDASTTYLKILFRKNRRKVSEN